MSSDAWRRRQLACGRMVSSCPARLKPGVVDHLRTCRTTRPVWAIGGHGLDWKVEGDNLLMSVHGANGARKGRRAFPVVSFREIGKGLTIQAWLLLDRSQGSAFAERSVTV